MDTRKEATARASLGACLRSGGTDKRVDRFRIASSPWTSDGIAGSSSVRARRVQRRRPWWRPLLSDTSLAHGPAGAFRGRVGHRPLISEYQVMGQPRASTSHILAAQGQL
jgi:hypothetical protein